MTLLKVAQKAKFNKIKKDLDEHGVQHYSLHKRIAIPKDELSLDDLKGLGFRKSYTGIPEPGQVKFRSYRNDDKYHIHDHGEKWVMHRDRHNPIGKSIKDKYNHVREEAIPALKDYLSWDKGISIIQGP